MTFCWRADSGPLIVVFGSSHQLKISKPKLSKLRSEIVWHRFFAVPAFIRRFRSHIAVRKLLVYTSPNFSSSFCTCESFWQSPDILGKIEKHASRLRQFDVFETPSMNVYGNDNIFIIISGSGYINWREIRGKL